ncbi:MAG TPA: hypothetical protein VE545_09855 [Candidatus Dormibacteraeota bacterium]|nr:hypothetical protein [Candidatus Dormibacteraeota bacterium]
MPKPALYRRSQNLVRTSLFVVGTIGLLAVFGPQLAAQDASHSPGWVVISVPDYHALRIKAFPTEREPEPPPVDATLSRVEYELLANSGVASGRATLTVDVLKNGWVRVPIPAGLFVRDAKLDGKPLSLAPANGGGQLSALLAHTGRAVIALEVALPVETSAGEERLSLPSTSSGVTRVTLEIPRTGVDLTLYGGIFAGSKELPDKNKWIAYGSGAQPVVFAWRRKVEEHQNTLPLRLHGALTQFVGLGEDSTSLSANVALEVVQGIAKEARVRIPDHVTINQVQGAAVADWDMKSGELLVTFIEPVEQSTSFVITGEATLPRDGVVDIPLLRLAGVERETGGLGIDVLGAGEIKEDSVKTQGLLRADATDLGEPVSSRQSPALLAFRIHSGDSQAPRSVNVTVTRYTQQAVLLANVTEARYRVLFTKDGKSLVEARYAVRNSQRSFVKIALPAGATLWSAAVSGVPIRPGTGPDGSLLVPLSKARSGEEAPDFAVEVIYFAPGAGWTDKGRVKLALPALDLPVSRTGLQVFYPPHFRLATDAGSFRTEDYADPISEVLNSSPEEPPVDSESSPPASGALSMAALTPATPRSGDRGVAPKGDETKQSAQTLVDKFHANERGSRAAGVLPLTLNLPTFGPSLYLVSQLTSENQIPSVEFSYQQDKKAGGK